MARKTLLTENELRQFMKLANLTPIGQVKLTELGYNDLGEEMAPPGELEDYAAGDLERGHPDEAAADEEDAGLEMGDDELDAEAGLEEPAPEGGAGMISVDDFMVALESALEDVLGEPVSTEMDDELGAEDDLEGDEMDMEIDMEDGPDELEVTASEEEEVLPGMRNQYQEGKSQEDVVNEVARRVAIRLQKENNQSAMVDQLTKKILKRLTK
jgi:hypothetical protein